MELGAWQSLPGSFSLPSGLDVSVVHNPPPSQPARLSVSSAALVDSQLLSAAAVAAGGPLSSSIAAALLAPTLSELRQQTSRQRKYNFSSREKELLVSLIEQHGDVVESRAGSCVTIDQKMHAWNDIECRFNEHTGASGQQARSVSELKKCYWNLKQKTKKALEAERDASGAVSVDRVLWRIAQLAPEQFEGLLDARVVVAAAPSETELTVKDEAFDACDIDLSQLESPGPSQQPSPPSKFDLFPIPSDYLSVEMSSAPPAPSSSSASAAAAAIALQQLQQLQEQQRAASCSSPLMAGETGRAAAVVRSMLPGLTAINGCGSGAGLLRDRLADVLDAEPLANGWCSTSSASSNGVGGSSSNKRPAPDSPDDAVTGGRAADALRRAEHELRMRLLRQEADFMKARHKLEMDVLEQQRVFWSEALKRARVMPSLCSDEKQSSA